MTRLAIHLVSAGLVCFKIVAAQETAEDPAHVVLRALRVALTAAVKQGDIDAMLEHVHPAIVATFMDGRQARGRDEVRKYFQMMLKGPERVVDKYDLEVDIQELTTLYGDDSGVAAGRATSHFDLTDGRQFVAEGPWTATVVKHDGRWVLASFHSSTNVFDNGVLDLYVRWLSWLAVGAGVVGLAVGCGIGWLLKTRRQARSVKPT